MCNFASLSLGFPEPSGLALKLYIVPCILARERTSVTSDSPSWQHGGDMPATWGPWANLGALIVGALQVARSNPTRLVLLMAVRQSPVLRALKGLATSLQQVGNDGHGQQGAPAQLH